MLSLLMLRLQVELYGTPDVECIEGTYLLYVFAEFSESAVPLDLI